MSFSLGSPLYYTYLYIYKNLQYSDKTNTPVWLRSMGTNKSIRKKIGRIRRKMLRKITGPVFDDNAGMWRIRHNWEIRERTEQPNISQVAKARRMQWAGHMARMEEDRVPKRIYQAQMIGRRPVGRPRKNWDIMPDGGSENAGDRSHAMDGCGTR